MRKMREAANLVSNQQQPNQPQKHLVRKEDPSPVKNMLVFVLFLFLCLLVLWTTQQTVHSFAIPPHQRATLTRTKRLETRILASEATKKLKKFEETKTLLRKGKEKNDDKQSFQSGFVCVTGNPNVGKSSLLNALVGQKLNIVTHKPGTTRHRINVILNSNGGSDGSYQLVFSDTPGVIQSSLHELHKAMTISTHAAVVDADVVVVMTDVFDTCDSDTTESFQDMKLLRQIQENLAIPVIVVINKIDLLKKSSTAIASDDDMIAFDENGLAVVPTKLLASAPRLKKKRRRIHSVEAIASYWRQLIPRAVIHPMSVTTGANVSALITTILPFIPQGPQYFFDNEDKNSSNNSNNLNTQETCSMVSDRNERFFASEIIRENIFKQFRNEIPYRCSVIIRDWIDKEQHGHQATVNSMELPTLSVIDAIIVVDRKSHEDIICGQRCEAIKKLGIQSRLALEQFLNRKVFLTLKTKVNPNWKNNKKALADYGYL